VPEDGGRGESNFEILKGLLTGGGPLKDGTFVSKGDEGADETGKSTNKPTVEVSKAKEALYVFEV